MFKNGLPLLVYEDIGGSAYLARLANAAVSLEYAKNYAQIIYDLAVRRSLYDLGGKLSYNAIESEMDTNPSDLVEDAERDLYQIAEKGTNAHNVQTFKSSMEEAVELMKKAYEKDSNVVGIETNFRDLDQKLGGLHNSDLLILIDAIVIVIRSNGIFNRPIVPKIVKQAMILGTIVTKAI